MFEATTRPLHGDERERLEQRRVALEQRVAAEERAQARSRRDAVLAVLLFSGVFAAIAVFNAIAGQSTALVVALVGALWFAAVAVRIGRRFEHSFAERREIDRIDRARTEDAVRVYTVIADAALVLHDPDDEHAIVGWLLRSGANEVVHVDHRYCGSIAPELLPTTHLRVDCVEPLGVVAAHALGEPLEPTQRCPLARSTAIEPYIVEAWTAEPPDLEALARRLAPAS